MDSTHLYLRRLGKAASLVLAVLLSPFVFAQALLEDAPKGALVITQSAWHSQNTQYLANPASLMKILTATLVADRLGQDFRFQTQLMYRVDKVKSGHLSSSLTVQLSGDPSLTQADLQQMLKTLKKQGVTSLSKVSIDASRYRGHGWSLGQVWNDHGICFAAPTGAAIINRNCVFGNLKATKVGQKARLFMTPGSPLKIDNEVITLAASDAKHCQVLLTILGSNHYRLSGCRAKGSYTLPLGFSGNDGQAFFAHILGQELALLGFGEEIAIDFIPHSPKANLSHSTQIRTVTHSSAPMLELVARMLRRSDNLIADSLFKAAGYQYGLTSEFEGKQDAYLQGEQALMALLAQHQIATQGLVVRDGSGLSRENLLYADTLYQVLTLWLTKPEYAWLQAALPVGAQSGTLKYRQSLKDQTLKGRVLAKSGSMQGVVNLAGFVDVLDKDNRTQRKPFVFIVNQFTKSKALAPSRYSEEEQRLFQLEANFLKAAQAAGVSTDMGLPSASVSKSPPAKRESKALTAVGSS